MNSMASNSVSMGKEKLQNDYYLELIVRNHQRAVTRMIQLSVN